MASLVVSVAAGADDAHEAGDGTGFDGTAAELKAYADATGSSQFHAGMRFTGLTIPAGSTISAATLDIEITTSDDARVAIRCEDVDNAVDFLADSDVTSRPTTTASTNWIQNNLGLGLVTSVDFAASVQEVIDRDGWVSGNALAVIFRGFASGAKQLDFAAFEHATAAPVQLTVTYTEPASSDENEPFVLNRTDVVNVPAKAVGY